MQSAALTPPPALRTARSADTVCGIERTGGPLAFLFLQRIQGLKGNDVCFDCSTMDPDWASVTHGTLVCLTCAGRHRTLGVHVSRIKSLTMDAGEPVHVAVMLLSGNLQVKGFFRRQKVHNTAIEQLYTSTRAAEFYRKELANQIDLEIAKYERGERCVLDEVPLPPASPTHPNDSARKSLDPGLEAAAASAASAAAATLTTEATNATPSDSTARFVASAPRVAQGVEAATGGEFCDEHFEAIIEDQGLGLTLHREVTPFGNFSKVTRVKAGGGAQKASIAAGDYVVGAAGRVVQDYDKVGERFVLDEIGEWVALFKPFWTGRYGD